MKYMLMMHASGAGWKNAGIGTWPPVSRAKQRIRTSGVPFRLPTADERAERLGAVLHVLYLIFNEGYATSSGAALHRASRTKRSG